MGSRTHDYYCFRCYYYTNGFEVDETGVCGRCGSTNITYDVNWEVHDRECLEDTAE